MCTSSASSKRIQTSTYNLIALVRLLDNKFWHFEWLENYNLYDSANQKGLGEIV
jgi:hypothetical protein